MAPLSSYFSWGLPSLPAMPSLFQLSLPDNIQKRFISYILKRSLGKFIRGDGLDVDRIEAQMGQGSIQMDRLDVDTSSVNELIPPGIPLHLRSGLLSRVNAKIPLQNPWGDHLTLSVGSVALEFDLCPPSSPGARSPIPSFLPPSESHSLDLTASVVHVAQEFVSTELDAFEEATLHRSIQDSLHLSPSSGRINPHRHAATDPSSRDPFYSPDSSDSEGFSAPGAFPMSPINEDGTDATNAGVLAGLVERILARLRIKVESISIRIRFSSSNPSGTDGDDVPSAFFEIKVDRIKYADESEEAGNGTASEIVRVLRLGHISMRMLDLTPRQTSGGLRNRQRSLSSRGSDSDSTASLNTLSGMAPAPPRVPSQHSSDSDFTDREGGAGAEVEMMMSMAIADLRESTAELKEGSSPVLPGQEKDDDDDTGAGSLYESAMDGSSDRAEDDVDMVLDHPIVDPFAADDPLPGKEEPLSNDPPEMDEMDNGVQIVSFGPTETVLRLRRTLEQESLPSVSAELEIGDMAVLLLPWQIRILSLVSQVWSNGISLGTESPPQPKDGTAAKGSSHLNVAVHSFLVGVVHQGRSLDVPNEQSLLDFWAKSAEATLPVDHLRLHLANITVTSDSAAIKDLSFFEYLISDRNSAVPAGSAVPIVIVDPLLGAQYDMIDGVAAEASGQIQPKPKNWPKFSYSDWRTTSNKHGSVKKYSDWSLTPWRTKAGKHDTKPTEAISVAYGGRQSPSLRLSPLHVYIDLSLIERMLPLLQSVSDVMEEHRTRLKLNGRRVISPRTTMSAQSRKGLSLKSKPDPTKSEDALSIECPALRFDLRCPAPVMEGQTWGDGAHLRSGIVTFDVHGLSASFKHSLGLSQGAGGGTLAKRTTVTAGWDQLLFFFCRSERPHSVAHLITGPLKLEPEDAVDGRLALTPSLVYRSSDALGSAAGPGIDLHVPSIRAFVDHDVTEGLQFFADDFTHWLEGAFGDGASVPRDDIRMIGSRFFGPVASPASSLSDESKKDTSWTIRLTIAEVELRLAPRLANPSAVASSRHHRNIVSLASDLSIIARSLTSELKTELLIESDITSMTLADVLDNGSVVELLQRSRRSALSLNPKPFLSLRLSSSKILLSNIKETAIKLHLAGFTWRLSPELAWASDLAFMARTPPGVFEDVAPSEITKLAVTMENISVLVPGVVHRGALLVYLAQVDLRTTLVAGASDKSLKLDVATAELLAIDQLSGSSPAAQDTAPVTSSGITIWQRQGFISLARIDGLDATVLLRGDSSLDVQCTQQAFSLVCCADSLYTLSALLTDVARSWSKSDTDSAMKIPGQGRDEPLINVFGSIDERAFASQLDPLADMDMIGDDLPNDPQYLANLGKTTISRRGRNSETPAETALEFRDMEDSYLGADHRADVRIRILHTGPLHLEEDYWDSIAAQQPIPTRRPTLHLSLKIFDLGILLHDGYDWEQTRATIEAEMKAVKRKLQKLRQILASGQQPDDSIQAAGSVLFDSVLIGLPEEDDHSDQGKLLAAINNHLEQMNADSEAGSQPDTWQAINPPEGARPTPMSRRKRKLLRSTRPSMEIRVKNAAVNHKQFGVDAETAARSAVKIEALDVLDHIKTSTWKKFLTEMRSDSRKEIRETDVSMIDIDLTQVRPTARKPDTEMRLFVDILPLRFHVDQDALDFMTKFFSFKGPSDEKPSGSAATSSSRDEPYFQHVEISPIKLKLDYKPKRVNMRALRKGRTMELMNFFHFEATEMTLRHLTLSGISGWTTLTDTLNDVWAPDVKANQIADVVAGVAPIRSLVNVGTGMANLVLLPIEHYRRDGTVSRGVQRGAKSFLKSTAMEALKLGAQLATGTQVVLERATNVLGGDFDRPIRGEAMSEEDAEQGPISRYAQQPRNLREGVSGAYESITKNVNAAAQTILAIPMEVEERSDNGTVRAVIRAVPIAMLQPMIGATEAVSKTLFGLRNEIDPRALRELEQKYKSGS